MKGEAGEVIGGIENPRGYPGVKGERGEPGQFIGKQNVRFKNRLQLFSSLISSGFRSY